MREIKIDKKTAEQFAIIQTKIQLVNEIIELIAKEQRDVWIELKAKYKDLNFKDAYIFYPTNTLKLPAEENNKQQNQKPEPPKGRKIKEGVPPPKP